MLLTTGYWPSTLSNSTSTPVTMVLGSARMWSLVSSSADAVTVLRENNNYVFNIRVHKNRRLE